MARASPTSRALMTYWDESYVHKPLAACNTTSRTKLRATKARGQHSSNDGVWSHTSVVRNKEYGTTKQPQAHMALPPWQDAQLYHRLVAPSQRSHHRSTPILSR